MASPELKQYLFKPPPPGPLNPYRAVGDEALRLTEIREFTGSLGKLCEKFVCQIWKGTIAINEGEREKLWKATEKVTEVLLPVQKRILSEEEINEYYQAIGNPVGMWFEGIEPKDPNLKFIFETLDKTLGVDFLRTYRQLPQVGKTLAHVRYLVEATLILAKEICQPTLRPEDGTLLTNVYVPSLTQFDAVLVSGPTATQISSFKEVLVNPQPYDIIQLKTVFRARSTSGKKKLTKLPQEFKREQERQLGLTVWWWLSQGNETFPFPRSIVYHFLRGFMPHVVHRTKIDFLFFQRWAWLLEENISSAPEEQREHLSRLVVLLNQAEIKLTDRFRKEAAAIFAQLQANRVEEKAEQPPLFTL